MKNHYFKVLIVCFSLNSFAYGQGMEEAKPVDAKKEEIKEVIEAVSKAEKTVKAIKRVGLPARTCPDCKPPIDPNDRRNIDNKKIDLGQPDFWEDDTTYVVHLKRTKDSPAKFTMKMKIGHRACGDFYIGTNPMLPSGPLVGGCVYYRTFFEDQEIDVNLKSLTKPVDDEEQIIELRIHKPIANESKYSVEAEVLKGPPAKVEQSKMFWGDGYNVTLENR